MPMVGYEKSFKSGVLQNRQRYPCKSCGYHFTAAKVGKRRDDCYVTKA